MDTYACIWLHVVTDTRHNLVAYSQGYIVLTIITDGAISDMDNTVT